MKKLSDKEKACNYETMQHIHMVQHYLHKFIKALLDRAEKHDKSKLESPEVEIFTEYTEKLAGCTYNSDEYKANLKAMEPALIHHYAKNRHHTEHFPEGINDFNLIDLIEMYCDWKAATMRHHDGNLQKSIDTNTKRYNISEQLKRILENTLEFVEE